MSEKEFGLTNESKDTQPKHRVWDKLIAQAKDLLRQDFQVDASRANAYYDFDRRDVPDREVEYVIPIGKSDSIVYRGVPTGGVIDRGMDEYLNWFFRNQMAKDFRSEEETFGPGKVTVDLGSGRAIGLMELSEKYPEAVIIGLDALYQEQRRLKLNKPGLQLSNANWENLSGLKNESVDNVISLQGVLMWGLPGVGGRRFEKFDAQLFQKVMNEIRRVLKVGGVIRLDGAFTSSEELDVLKKELDPTVWEVSEYPTLLIARKIS